MSKQSLRQLAIANRIRSERRLIKGALRERRLYLDEVLEECPDCAKTARAYDVIRWAPGFGKIKAEAAMKRLGEPVHRLLGDMPLNRRRELVSVIAKRNRKALWGAAFSLYVC